MVKLARTHAHARRHTCQCVRALSTCYDSRHMHALQMQTMYMDICVHRQAGSQTDRQTDTDRQMQTDNDRHRHTNRHRWTQTHTEHILI